MAPQQSKARKALKRLWLWDNADQGRRNAAHFFPLFYSGSPARDNAVPAFSRGFGWPPEAH